MSQLLPADWKRFLDGIDSHLQVLLEEAEAKQAPVVGALQCEPNPSLSDVMKRIHEGMDERLSGIEARLLDLDHSLAILEAEAQVLQESARFPAAHPAP